MFILTKTRNIFSECSNVIPAIIYDKNYGNSKIYINYKYFYKKYINSSIYGRIIKIRIKESIFNVIIKNIKLGLIKNNIKHLDFQICHYTKVVMTSIPVKLIGYNNSIGLKKGGILYLSMKNIPIKCLPMNIPSYININILKLDIKQVIHIYDIKIKGIKIILKNNLVLIKILNKLEEKLSNDKERLESESN